MWFKNSFWGSIRIVKIHRAESHGSRAIEVINSMKRHSAVETGVVESLGRWVGGFVGGGWNLKEWNKSQKFCWFIGWNKKWLERMMATISFKFPLFEAEFGEDYRVSLNKNSSNSIKKHIEIPVL